MTYDNGDANDGDDDGENDDDDDNIAVNGMERKMSNHFRPKSNYQRPFHSDHHNDDQCDDASGEHDEDEDDDGLLVSESISNQRLFSCEHQTMAILTSWESFSQNNWFLNER